MRARRLKLPPLISTVLSIFLFNYYLSGILAGAAASTATHEIQRGFSAAPDSKRSSSAGFQPLLTDPTGVFSFGFLRVNSDRLDLTVLHIPSSFPVWRAIPDRPARWAESTNLSFDGRLVLSAPETGVLWSTTQTAAGESLLLLNSSDLRVLRRLGEPDSVLWRSFDFPSDTLVQGQNFTSSAALFSPNRRFSMSLGPNYLALYMEFDDEAAARRSPPMYWKHTALEAKAQIVEGDGPIYARVEPAGFLGMYQKGRVPVDVLPFDTFNRAGITGLRRLTLESDGNLRAYYWNGAVSWVRDLEAISEPCGLPTACAPYELCSTATGQRTCQCLDSGGGCPPAGSGDFCGTVPRQVEVVRRRGVEVANKELLGLQHRAKSAEECEWWCASNCSCWGALYSNSSGLCYRIDYPIQTLLEAADEGKVGYFKVIRVSGSGEEARRRTGVALVVVGAALFAGAVGYGSYRVWERRKGRRSLLLGLDGPIVEGLSPGPYKDLASTSSFGSIELSNSFRK